MLLREIPEEKIHSPDSEDFFERLELELIQLDPGEGFEHFWEHQASLVVLKEQLDPCKQ